MGGIRCHAALLVICDRFLTMGEMKQPAQRELAVLLLFYVVLVLGGRVLRS